MMPLVEVQYNRSRKVTVRFTIAEYERMQGLATKTTCRQLSEYIRKLVLGKPVTVKVRHQSLDHLLEELVVLKGELKAIGHNYNQAVKKLHTLRQLPEFRAWLATHEETRQILLQQTEKLSQRIAQIADKWSFE